MGLMSGLAFSATLDHAEEIANIKKRLDKIEKRLAKLEKENGEQKDGDGDGK